MITLYYDKFGFESQDALKEYGKELGKDYTGKNFREGYENIFGVSMYDIKWRRDPIFKKLEALKKKNEIKINSATFSFTLDIGRSISGLNKTTTFKTLELSKSLQYINVDELKRRTVIQVTPFVKGIYEEEFAMSIRDFYFEVLKDDQLKSKILVLVVVINSRAIKTWNSSLCAFLTVFINANDVEMLKPI